MRSPVLLAVFLASSLLALPALADDGVPHLSQVKTTDLAAVATGSIPLNQVALTYQYNNQWGIEEVWQLDGTTLLYRKSVHTAPFADEARAVIAGGGSLHPLQAQVLALEYGDFDKCYRTTLSAAQVQSLYQTLSARQLTAAPARVGCGEQHWEINLRINGKQTQKFDVNAPGNDILAACIDSLQDVFSAEVSSMTPISLQEWSASYQHLITAQTTGS